MEVKYIDYYKNVIMEIEDKLLHSLNIVNKDELVFDGKSYKVVNKKLEFTDNKLTLVTINIDDSKRIC